MPDEFLFSEIDPKGYCVSLSSEQYYRHIIKESGHNEVSPEDIRTCVISPVCVYKSTYPYAERAVYFSNHTGPEQKQYIKAVTEFEGKSMSQVVTAFSTDSISGGIDTSEGGLLYCDPEFKLR